MNVVVAQLNMTVFVVKFLKCKNLKRDWSLKAKCKQRK